MADHTVVDVVVVVVRIPAAAVEADRILAVEVEADHILAVEAVAAAGHTPRRDSTAAELAPRLPC